MSSRYWRLNNGSDVEILDYSSLSPEDRRDIVAPLVALTSDAFLRFQVNEEITDDTNKHTTMAPRLRIAYLGGCVPVGFIASATFAYDGEPAYYLGGIIIRTDFQRTNLGLRLIDDELQQTQARILALQTQNGRMLGLMKKFVDLDPILSADIAYTRDPARPYGVISKGVYREGTMALYDDIDRFVAEGCEIRQEDLVFLLNGSASDFDWKHGDALFLAGRVKSAA